MEKSEMTSFSNIVVSAFAALFFFFAGNTFLYAQNSVAEIQNTINKIEKETKNAQSRQKSIDSEIKRRQVELDRMKRSGEENSKKYQQGKNSLNALKRNSSEYGKKAEALEASKGIYIGNYNDVLPFALRNSANTSELYGNSDLIKSIWIKYSIKQYYEKVKGLDFEKKQAEIAKQNSLRKENELKRSLSKMEKNIKSDNSKKAAIEKAIKAKKEEKKTWSRKEKDLIAERNKNYTKLAEMKKILRKAEENVKKNANPVVSATVSKDAISLPAAGKIISKNAQKCVKIKSSANAPVKAIFPGEVRYDGPVDSGKGNVFWIQTKDDYYIMYNFITLKGSIRHNSNNNVYANETVAYAGNDGTFEFCIVHNQTYLDAEKYVR